MKIVFLDAATMGDASMAEIAALGEFVCYPSSTAEPEQGHCGPGLPGRLPEAQARVRGRDRHQQHRRKALRRPRGHRPERRRLLHGIGRADGLDAHSGPRRPRVPLQRLREGRPVQRRQHPCRCRPSLHRGLRQDPRHRRNGRHRPESRRHRHGLRDAGHLLFHLRHRPLQGLPRRLPGRAPGPGRCHQHPRPLQRAHRRTH